MMTNLTSGNLNEHKNRGGIAHKLPDISPKLMREWLLAIEPLQPMPTKPGKTTLSKSFCTRPCLSSHLAWAL